MDSNQDCLHIFVVSTQGQGNVNPLLRLSKLLASKPNILVTFSSTKSVANKFKKAGANVSGDPTPVGNHGGMIRFDFFDDGCSEHNDDQRHAHQTYLPKLEASGKKSLTGILNLHAQHGRPVSCIINTPFLPWIPEMAEELKIPSALLWVQSCASFSSYYHYETSLALFPSEEQPDIDVCLPNMPVLKSDEVPTFLHPFTPYPILRGTVLRQFRNLSKSFCVLIETFQELEDDLIKYTSQTCPLRPVGPLVKYPLPETSLSVSGDLIKADNCLEWLDSKDPLSVVYISFGSGASLSQEQVNEMAYGVLNSGVSFLWVVRTGKTFHGDGSSELPEGFMEAAGEKGMVVHWAPQARVLSHPAVSCFVTHCGWNSTMEAVSSGVPVVAFPRWGDQVTDAKYLVDEWNVGVRMCRGEAENVVTRREAVEGCLRQVTSGVTAAKLKENALKWKKEAEEAVAEGGTSDRNIQEFVDDIRRISMEKLGRVS